MKWTIQLSLAATTNSGPCRVSFEGLKPDGIKVSGVSIKDMKVESQKIMFALRAGPRNRQATMQFPVLCNGQNLTLKLILDLSKPPAKNGSVPVRLVK